MSSSAVATEQKRIRTLIASNLYDTKIVGELEQYVLFQIKNSVYDAESNRELLKLYSVAPDMIKESILGRLLVKSLMELPSPDFFTSLYLISESLHTLESVKLTIKLQTLLETCQFKLFWKTLDQFKNTASNAAIINFAEIKDFDQKIRAFIALTLSCTYSTLSTSQLKELWNCTDKKIFDETVAANGWTFTEEGKTVVIRNTPQQSAKETVKSSYPQMESIAKLVMPIA